MSFAAAFLLIAQSAVSAGAPSNANAPAPRQNSIPASTPATVAERVTVSARILRPARIDFDEASGADADDQTRSRAVQRGRDAAGTVWVEFS